MKTLVQLLNEKAILKLFIATVFGFAFSIAVILSTVGLMDGFANSLVQILKKSSGDFIVTPTESNDLEELLRLQSEWGFQLTKMYKSYALLSSQDHSHGVEVYGIDTSSFSDVIKFDHQVSLSEMQSFHVILGQDLAKKLAVKKGDPLWIFENDRSAMSENSRVVVYDIVDLGIFEKNERTLFRVADPQVYEQRSKFKFTPLYYLRFDDDQRANLFESSHASLSLSLKRPWQDFKILLKAVEVEKKSMTFILQMIVLVSLFNVIALVLYIHERKTKSLFMFYALGVSRKQLKNFWFKVLHLIWIFSCLLSIGLTSIFDWLLTKTNILNIPSEIYVLSSLKLNLTLSQFLSVFGLSYLMLLPFYLYLVKKIKQVDMLEAIRSEYT